MKIHISHYYRPTGYCEIALCGKIVPQGRVLYLGNTRRATCKTCKATKKARGGR